MANTKTETTPNTNTETASNPFAGFSPLQAMQQAMAEANTRMTAFAAEYAALEAQLFTRVQGAIANWAQLANEAIAYSAQLSNQARKLGLETARTFSAASEAEGRA